MLTRLFDPAIKLLQYFPSGVKHSLMLIGALVLIISFSLHTYFFGFTPTYYLDVLLLGLFFWVYFYIANIYAIVESIIELKESLGKIAKAQYHTRISNLNASEFDLFLEDGNNMLQALERNSSFLNEYKRVVDASSPLVKTDTQGKITYVNSAYEKLSGYSAEELIGKTHALVRSTETSDKYLHDFWETILSKNLFKGEFQNVNSEGEPFVVESTVVPILDEKGEIYEFISIMFDITERKAQALALERQLYTDTLTGLPNRNALHKAIEEHFSHKLMLVNIDDFTTINTIYGEQVGDVLIVEMAKHLKEMLSSEKLSLYRHSGDEFAILADEKVPEAFFKEDTVLMAHQLNPTLLDCSGHEITIRVRIGAAHGSQKGNPRSLVSMASLALRNAKGTKQAYMFYSEDVDNFLHLEENFTTIEMLDYALKNSLVKVHFQPIANTMNNTVEKYEALVRVMDKQGTLHYPNAFISIAKGARLYSKLSQEVFLQTLEMAKRNPLFEFSFNIEMADILDAETRAFVLKRLRESNCAERIVFELVESEELVSNEEIYHFFKLLKSEGAKIAIDDFGSGYSSYAYLMKLGVDIVKIDGSLVSNINTNSDHKRIVKSIINIMHDLGMKVVAEYIESKEIYQTVVLLGADYAQGHFIEEAIGSDNELI